jgi:hypothetical protein
MEPAGAGAGAIVVATDATAMLAPSSTGRAATTHCPAGHCGELAAEEVGGVQEGRRVVERSRPGPAVCGHHGMADLCLREVGDLLPHSFARLCGLLRLQCRGGVSADGRWADGVEVSNGNGYSERDREAVADASSSSRRPSHASPP